MTIKTDRHEHSDHCDCSDSNCAHEHHDECTDKARAVVENSLRYSDKKWVALDAPAALGEIEASVRIKLLRIAENLAVDGVVLGHIKAIITAGTNSCVLSVTKVNKADVKYIGGWDGEVVVREYSLTVNVLSIVNTELDVKSYLM